ncbi:MAG: hypothetical protein ACKO37_09955 [Vampirovibrionales bacterium]
MLASRQSALMVPQKTPEVLSGLKTQASGRVSHLVQTHERSISTLATWVVAPLLVPLIHYTQDRPEERRRLFIRDFSSLSIGATLFFTASTLTSNLLKHTKAFAQKASHARLLSLGAGLVANVLFTGFIAVPLSRWLDARLSQRKSLSKTKAYGDTFQPRGAFYAHQTPVYSYARQGGNPSVSPFVFTKHTESSRYEPFYPVGMMKHVP